MQNIDTAELIKYLFGFLVSIGGSYLVFIMKTISRDIEQMKELLQTQIKTVADDVIRHRSDLDELYNFNRSISERIAVNESEIKSLREEHNRCQEGKK